jgi:hypothetical protein
MDVVSSVIGNLENRALEWCGHSEWSKEVRSEKNVFWPPQGIRKHEKRGET